MQTVSTYGSILNFLFIFEKIKNEIFILFKHVIWRAYCFLYFYHQVPLYKRLENATQSLTKMPSHVSLLVFEDNISMEDLALAIAFCLALGISCVSICTRSGKLNSQISYPIIFPIVSLCII